MAAGNESLSDVDLAIETVCEKVANEECILFLGSGVHYPPPDDSHFSYPEEQRPPLGASLSKTLARECRFAEKFDEERESDLQRVSLWYEISTSRQKLVNRIRQEVDEGKRPSPALRALARLAFKLIITTNYDQLFERALRMEGKEPRCIVYSPDGTVPTPNYFDPTSKSPILLKIHGSVDKPESLVVTDEDYIQFLLRMSDKEAFHPVPMTFRFYLQKWATLFIGYSLHDYNLRLLFKALRWRIDPANIPDSFSVDKHPDPLILDVWWNQSRYVRFIAQDVWTFVPELYRRVKGEEMLL